MAETVVAPFRWTSAAYAQAVAAGVFAGRRVELLGGEILERAPEGPAHVVHEMQVVEVLTASLPAEAGHIREAHPIALREPVRTAAPANPVGWTYRQQDRWSVGQTVTPPIDGAQPLPVASLFATA
jgi:hypothetical protein